ncbi:enoyl-CoA hydratase [Hyphococcus luteus]|uniref:Enoyl-CoA hydratase n=1 Tax=Hyphococcus luteus TaxID=2058213 RepID=A0A2S7K3L0_9PROT|nr:enoyl-CoA hydratase [Marinicaulis flavus]PQA87094.1 enoyl-CoA hydratase [Marinicaulis flavus]
MSDHISVSRESSVLRLAFNRPEKKNAITAAMYAVLADALAEAEGDEAVRAVVFESKGDVFTSGNDIADFMAGTASLGAEGEKPPVIRFLEAIATAEKPLIAAVQGPAVGVGVTMLLHCDLVYASEAATFHTPFVDLALVPEAASSFLLPQIAGHQRAAEMLILGKKIGAARARELGFVNEAVAPDALEETALASARAIAEKAPAAMKLTKQLMKDGNREDILARMKEEGAHFAAQLQSAEFREAGMAFMQKRKPDFSKLG